jgi:hypothetical protein
MKTPFLLATGLALAAGSALAATSAIPERRTADRYDKMPQDWPFALATAVVPVAEPAKGWASDLYVSSIAKDNVDGGEKYFVGIKDRSGQNSFTLSGSETTSEDISLGGVKWSNDLKEIVVTLKKGSEFGTVKFDPQLFQSPPAAAAPVPRGPGGVPSVNPNFSNQRTLAKPMPPGVPRPANISPVLPQNAPAVRPGGPSNTNSSNTNSNTNSPPPDTKHRVRVIKSGLQ